MMKIKKNPSIYEKLGFTKEMNDCKFENLVNLAKKGDKKKILKLIRCLMSFSYDQIIKYKPKKWVAFYFDQMMLMNVL